MYMVILLYKVNYLFFIFFFTIKKQIIIYTMNILGSKKLILNILLSLVYLFINNNLITTN